MDGKQIKQFVADQNCTWAAAGGSLYTNAAGTTAYAGASVSSVYFKADNESRVATLTATNGAAQATTANITVTGVCPAHPSWEFGGEHSPNFLRFVPDAGLAYRQERRKLGHKYRCDFQAGVRQAAELSEFLLFHQKHYGMNKNFKFVHPGSGTTYTSCFDAPLKEVWKLNNLVGYSTVIQEV